MSNISKKNEYIFTSESVSEGHPDKICDQISDSILDHCLSENENARVACEVFITNEKIIIGGEMDPMPHIDKIKEIARKVLDKIGYKSNYGDFDPKSCKIEVIIQKQSKEIKHGVDKRNNITCAGDQGIMFGYAIKESGDALMPLPIIIAHDLVRYASKLRKENKFKWARADMKSQVTLRYNMNKEPIGVHTVVMSIQHEPDYNRKEFIDFVKQRIIKKIIEKHKLKIDEVKTKILINPSGKFIIGGPMADTGLTGRKTTVDTYGGYSRNGGGSFSGKDYTKVDRSASYMARYVAKNIVAAGIAKEIEIELSYAIGLPKPISFWVDTKGTNKSPKHTNDYIMKLITNVFNFSINGMVEKLDLKKPIYEKTSVYGHFGRNEFAWEKTDAIDKIMSYINDKKEIA